jgi:hypothetical protein
MVVDCRFPRAVVGACTRAAGRWTNLYPYDRDYRQGSLADFHTYKKMVSDRPPHHSARYP